MSQVVCPVTKQAEGEETFNIVTHGLGIGLSVIGLLWIVFASFQKGDIRFVISSAVFGVALVLTYTASTLYHSRKSVDDKQRWRILDHLSIYILIAGTYTPFCLHALTGAKGRYLLIFVWTVAVVGITLKILFGHRFRRLEPIGYVLMGWSAIVMIVPLYHSLPTTGFALLVSGGITYTIGVVFYLWKSMPYNHGIWHLFVLGGSACHFFSVTISFDLML